MKRDWDVIRDVLIEVEGLTDEQRSEFAYHQQSPGQSKAKIDHALLLHEAGFIDGILSESLNAPPYLLTPKLTWEGHELLDTVRSKPVWEKIKSTAQEKGIELTFDAVIAIGKKALDWIIA